MNQIFAVIGIPLGWIMWALFKVINNYGIALLLFTVFSRLIMVPTTVKQQKTTAKMNLLQPQIQEIQKKYANNKDKMNQEMMDLYNKEKYNPMSGCLPMLIQFPILFGLIDVIYKPLTHILRLPADVIASATQIATDLGILTGNVTSSAQLSVLSAVSQNPGAFSSIGAEYLETMQGFLPQMKFLGLNLMQTPSLDMFKTMFSAFEPVLLIPILSGLTSLLLSLNTMRSTASSTQGQAGAGSMKGMMLVMPIFSAWFTFSVPAGVGLYWIYSNVVGFLQTVIINKIYNPKEMARKMQEEQEERKEQERQERIEARKRLKEQGMDPDDDKGLSKKEANRRKLAAARKRDAEKYGEEYEEVGDIEEDII